MFDRHTTGSYALTMITWDEAKRKTNIQTHGIDFAGCEAVFDNPTFSWDDDRETYGELQLNLLG